MPRPSMNNNNIDDDDDEDKRVKIELTDTASISVLSVLGFEGAEVIWMYRSPAIRGHTLISLANEGALFVGKVLIYGSSENAN